jgi:hypothetical protein
VKHFATPEFWYCYRQLPSEIRDLADKNFELLETDPAHPSLRFKKVGTNLWSARVGLRYRALAVEHPHGFIWYWIGRHSDYDRLLGK